MYPTLYLADGLTNEYILSSYMKANTVTAAMFTHAVSPHFYLFLMYSLDIRIV